MLYPFVRHGSEILFVGLNPGGTSSQKGHYFSTNSALWNQLYESGLITRPVDKNVADKLVFRSSRINANGWEYGITDLVDYLAESDSRKVNPTRENCKELMQTILEYKPKVVVLLHGKIIKHFVKGFLGKEDVEYGNLGKLIDGFDTVFFNVPFPCGNAITTEAKVELYKQVKEVLETWDTMIDISASR